MCGQSVRQPSSASDWPGTCSQSSAISLHKLLSTYYPLRRREEHAYDIPLAEAQAPLVTVPLLKSTVILCYREYSFVLSAQAEHNRGRIRRTKLDRLTPAIAVDPS